jgi:transposase
MNTTLSPILVQRFCALQAELIPEVATEMDGLSPKLEQIIRVLEWSRIENLLQTWVSVGPGQPQIDRCALASAFIAKAVLDLKTTRALIERLQVDKRLKRICGFDMHRALPSEATFSRAFDEFATSELATRAHQQMIQSQLADSLIGHISRDSTAIEAREKVAGKPAKPEAPEPILGQAPEPTPEVVRAPVVKAKPGRPRKGEQRPPAPVSPLERQSGQNLTQMLAELPLACSVGTKKNASGYKISWKGYKLHLDTACCGVVISAVLTGAAVHDSRVALPLSIISAQRVDYLYELMDAAYCSTIIRDFVSSQGRVPLIDHNPRAGEKIEFAPAQAQRYNTRSGAERTNARLKDEFGARHVYVRGNPKVMSHLMFGVVALCADQLMRLLQ